MPLTEGSSLTSASTAATSGPVVIHRHGHHLDAVGREHREVPVVPGHRADEGDLLLVLPRPGRVEPAVEQVLDEDVVHHRQARRPAGDDLVGVDPQQLGEDLAQLAQPVQAPVVADVGAVGVDVAARQRQQLLGEVELLGARLAAGEVELQATILEGGVRRALLLEVGRELLRRALGQGGGGGLLGHPSIVPDARGGGGGLPMAWDAAAWNGRGAGGSVSDPPRHPSWGEPDEEHENPTTARRARGHGRGRHRRRHERRRGTVGRGSARDDPRHHPQHRQEARGADQGHRGGQERHDCPARGGLPAGGLSEHAAAHRGQARPHRLPHRAGPTQGDCSDGVIGEAVVYTKKDAFAEDSSVDFGLASNDGQTYGMACLEHLARRAGPRGACSTHLPSAKGADRDCASGSRRPG